MRNALRAKQLQKGLEQLGDEGAIQVFRQTWGDRDPIVGAVGQLQFEVLTHRLQNEYGVEARLEAMPFELARWVEGDGHSPDALGRDSSTLWCEDHHGRPVVLFRSQWALSWVVERHPSLALRAAA